MTTSTKRIYVVTDRTTGNEFLVSATQRGRAHRHIADSQFGVRIASQGDMLRLLNQGTQVQYADGRTERDTP